MNNLNNATTETVEMGNAINKYNKKFKQSNDWKRFSDDKVRFSRPNENNERKVVTGIKHFGCEMVYQISNNELNVTTFKPESGGILISFCEHQSEVGFKYLLGLADALNLDSLTIYRKLYNSDNFNIFNKYGFTHYEDEKKSTFSIDFRNGKFHQLRRKHQQVMESLKVLKSEDKTIKTEWIKYMDLTNVLTYNYSFYAYGIKGTFSLFIEDAGMYLFESSLDIKVPVEDALENMNDVALFFDDIKTKGKIKALVNPSDVIFREVAPRHLGLGKEHYDTVFKYLSETYLQEELDKRLLAKDMENFREFAHTDYAITFTRVLDVYFLFNSKNNSLKFYEEKESKEAKNDFLTLATAAYKESMQEALNEMK